MPGPETHSFLWLERSPRGRGPFRALISSTIPPPTHTHTQPWFPLPTLHMTLGGISGLVYFSVCQMTDSSKSAVDAQ